jgi:hypothetical protein
VQRGLQGDEEELILHPAMRLLPEKAKKVQQAHQGGVVQMV